MQSGQSTLHAKPDAIPSTTGWGRRRLEAWEHFCDGERLLSHSSVKWCLLLTHPFRTIITLYCRATGGAAVDLLNIVLYLHMLFCSLQCSTSSAEFALCSHDVFDKIIWPVCNGPVCYRCHFTVFFFLIQMILVMLNLHHILQCLSFWLIMHQVLKTDSTVSGPRFNLEGVTPYLCCATLPSLFSKEGNPVGWQQHIFLLFPFYEMEVMGVSVSLIMGLVLGSDPDTGLVAGSLPLICWCN